MFREEKPVDPRTGEREFRPLSHSWRVEVAHGQLGGSRRLAAGFGNSIASATTRLQLAWIARVLKAISEFFSTPMGSAGHKVLLEKRPRHLGELDVAVLGAGDAV